jgi:CRISPR-associated protein Cas5t
MLCLYLQAPFGVFRTFTAGSFRPTADFITPSAAYGLLLNIAGIEMRDYNSESTMTLIKKNLPKIQLALGNLELPLKHSIYQQLHNYPVGSSGKQREADAKGNKYNIVPVRRAFLSGIKAYICIDGNDELETGIKEGLSGNVTHPYGLPFLGDNNFLIDRFEPVKERKPAYWYEKIEGDDEEGLREHITRLTITIDREDMSKTRSALFAPTKERAIDIPEKAWVEICYS